MPKSRESLGRGTMGFFVTLEILLLPLRICDWALGLLIAGYDLLVYNPLQVVLTPLMKLVPRHVMLWGRTRTVFTPNGVTWSRTVLVIPIAYCLKTGYFTPACLLIALHDFLDHLDGIVAKAQRSVYGAVNDPLLGGFMDAFCDKVVNVLSLWTILLLTNYISFSLSQTLLYLGVLSAIIAYEVVLGVVRVQDYYRVSSSKEKGVKSSSASTSAVMAGKLKEKLESVGLALLCLALNTPNPMESWTGVTGLTCFAVSLRFAHSSLMHKLRAQRTLFFIPSSPASTPTTHTPTYPTSSTSSSSATGLNGVVFATMDGVAASSLSLAPNPREKVQAATPNHRLLQHVVSMPELPPFNADSDSSLSSSSSDHEGEEKKQDDNSRVDKVYSIGCFDLFHRGHVNLLRSMRKLGKEVIIGVHTDESYVKLKNKMPIDNTEKRMDNVKRYADQVFVVSSTDPSPYIRCCVHLRPGEKALYIRGDDMPQFPGRAVAEDLMSIRLLPYTKGVSSTMLRAQLLAGRNGEE